VFSGVVGAAQVSVGMLTKGNRMGNVENLPKAPPKKGQQGLFGEEGEG
jgi:hypothetical protein